MKKHIVRLFCLILLMLSLVACSKKEIKDAEPTSTTILNSEAPKAESLPETAIVTSPLFNDLYLKFVNREAPLKYDQALIFLEHSGYKYEIIYESEGLIQYNVYADDTPNSDCVCLSFLDDSFSENMLISMSYTVTSKNLSAGWGNMATEGEAQYDRFATQVIGEAEKEVSGIKEQIDFLFK